MSRMSIFNSPFLLGFDDIERVIDRVAKSSGDGYPPYNIEKLKSDDAGEDIIITLAVAGFLEADLEVRLEDNQLIVLGAQKDDGGSDFLHRGIAARSFSRAFILAEGVDVTKATLKNGLLSIELNRPKPEKRVKTISIEHLDT